eukprot:SAG25_NODE_1051_length_4176_cov_7.655139_1_plen_64_part_00
MHAFEYILEHPATHASPAAAASEPAVVATQCAPLRLRASQPSSPLSVPPRAAACAAVSVLNIS